MPEIVADLGKEKTLTLFNTIISELKKNGLYTDDVLPEYVVLLLANRHPKEKIMSDLEGLLGSDVASAFTKWLFEEVERLKNNIIAPPLPPLPAAFSVPIAPSTSFQPPVVLSTIEDSVMRMSSFGGNRMFSSALKEASTEPSRQSRHRGTSRSDMVPEEGYRTRRNRSKSPQAMQVDRTERRMSPKRVVVRRGRDERDNSPKRLVSKEDGTIKIQVKDARELIGSRSPERQGRPRHGGRYAAIGMDVDPVPAMDVEPAGIARMQTGEEKPKKEKCKFFPECNNSECPFYHPTRICTHFPNCHHGEACTFIHPQIPCKFQNSCQNPICNYYHSPALAQSMMPAPPIVSTVVCKFYPNCVNPHCQFVHPVEIPCKFGMNCQRPGCHFKHPEGHTIAPKRRVFAPCIFGKNCAKPGCPYQHPTPDQTEQSDQMTVEPTPTQISQEFPIDNSNINVASNIQVQ